MKSLLLIIDPQNDFINGSLPVKNADDCMYKLSEFILDKADKIDDIVVTLDSHQPGHVSFKSSWITRTWENEPEISKITPEMIGNSVKPRFSHLNAEDIKEYIERIPGKSLDLWPSHCVIGTEGHAIYGPLEGAMNIWSLRKSKSWEVLLKGNRFDREMYSAIICDGEENFGLGHAPLINSPMLSEYDVIWIAGIAKDFCVAATVRDLINLYGEDIKNKLVFLEECMPIIIDGNESLNVYEDAVKNYGAVKFNFEGDEIIKSKPNYTDKEAEGYILVAWPESQSYMEEPGFDQNAYSVNKDGEYELFMIQKGWKDSIDNKRKNKD